MSKEKIIKFAEIKKADNSNQEIPVDANYYFYSFQILRKGLLEATKIADGSGIYISNYPIMETLKRLQETIKSDEGLSHLTFGEGGVHLNLTAFNNIN